MENYDMQQNLNYKDLTVLTHWGLDKIAAIS